MSTTKTLLQRCERLLECLPEATKPKVALLWQALKKNWLKGNLGRFAEAITDVQNAPHHWEWYRVLGNEKLRNIVVAAPRGHAKTTCFSVTYPLWRIAKNPNVRILMVSNTESQAQASLRQIKTNILRNQMFVDLFGQLKPKKGKWTDKEIIVERDDLGMKDPTIGAVGVGGTILSKRADEIICDDLLNPENTRTPEQRNKMAEWFHQVLLPVLVPGGRVIVAGTVWHPQDLLMELLKDAGQDYRKKFQAVISWPTNMDIWQQWYAIRMAGTEQSTQEAEEFFINNYQAMHEGVEVLWADRMPFGMLYLIWRRNRVSFEKSYQNNIVSREDQKFKEEWLERAKARGANLRLVRGLTDDMRKEFKVLTGGIDLAASEEEQADDNAMLSLGLRRLDDMVQLVGLDRGKFSPKEWRKTIAERGASFKHDRIIVESNGYQVALKRDLAEANLPIVAFTTGGEKLDPFIGVEAMAILFENDRIILPYDQTDPTTIALVDQLVDELRAFPAGHTGDSAMAMWFAFTALRDLMGQATSGFLQIVQQDLAKLKEKQGQGTGLPAWIKAAQQQSSK